MDATYRSDLRELNELNFARFDAKLEQRLAELRAEFRTALVVEAEGIRRELGEQDNRMAAMEARMITRIESAKSAVIKWSFAFYLGTALTVLGLKLF